jgi:hypothetical protein
MNLLFIGGIFKRMNEGGPLFMYPNFIILLVCIGLGVYVLSKGDTNDFYKKVISHLSLFAVAWGFLGMMIGLIGAFDAISTTENISTPMLAGGLKIGLLSPTFGLLVFALARIVLLVITAKEK